MALVSSLLAELKKVSGVSKSALSRWAARVKATYGPMSSDEARWVIAHDLGVDLQKHLNADQIDRVRELRAQGARWPVTESAPKRIDIKGDHTDRSDKKRPVTPQNQFAARDLHPLVVRSSRKLFVAGNRMEAVRMAFQAINNRVKKMSGESRDGYQRMFAALDGDTPKIALNAGSSQSERDEQKGAAHLFAGAILSQRNPRSHEVHWPPDDNAAYSLDCLALASLLHRLLDRVDS